MEFRPEFVDDALPALFAIATTRSSIAAANFVVLAGWALLTVVLTVILTVIGGLLVGLERRGGCPDGVPGRRPGDAGRSLGRTAGARSSWRRDDFPEFVALVALVV